MNTGGHTQGVNANASTLKGPSKAQIHLYPDSSPPLATGKTMVAECTHIVLLEKHTHTPLIYKQDEFFFSPGTHMQVNTMLLKAQYITDAAAFWSKTKTMQLNERHQ